MRCVDDFALFDNDTAALIRWREHESRVSLLGCPPRHHWWQLKRLRPVVNRSRQRSRASSQISRSRSSKRCSLVRHGGSIRRMSQVGRRTRSGCGSARTDWRPPCSGGPLGQSAPRFNIAALRELRPVGCRQATDRQRNALPPASLGQPSWTGLAGQHAARQPKRLIGSCHGSRRPIRDPPRPETVPPTAVLYQRSTPHLPSVRAELYRRPSKRSEQPTPTN